LTADGEAPRDFSQEGQKSRRFDRWPRHSARNAAGAVATPRKRRAGFRFNHGKSDGAHLTSSIHEKVISGDIS
jgi:hypothetical protein